MKKLLLLSTCAMLYTLASGQCMKPKPLTPAQVHQVTGTWTMQYLLEGKMYESQVFIRKEGSDKVSCQIMQPPLKEKETAGTNFFCPGGEFHIQKFAGENSYVFQGTPENGSIRGTLTLFDGMGKPTLRVLSLWKKMNNLTSTSVQ